MRANTARLVANILRRINRVENAVRTINADNVSAYRQISKAFARSRAEIAAVGRSQRDLVLSATADKTDRPKRRPVVSRAEIDAALDAAETAAERAYRETCAALDREHDEEIERIRAECVAAHTALTEAYYAQGFTNADDWEKSRTESYLPQSRELDAVATQKERKADDVYTAALNAAYDDYCRQIDDNDARHAIAADIGALIADLLPNVRVSLDSLVEAADAVIAEVEFDATPVEIVRAFAERSEQCTAK